jgi:predicted AlkP superfamily pyrophosphatase or phosphodiesterase
MRRRLRSSLLRRIAWVAILLATASAMVAAQAAQVAPRAADHVILISIDGLKPEYYLGGGANAPAVPNLTGLRERGSWAEGVIAQYPSLTYVGHTSLATGLRPVRHGVVENTIFEPATGASTRWVFNASAIKAPAIWDMRPPVSPFHAAS